MDIESIIRKMSLEDKIALCEGADFWQTKAFEKYGIPAMFMCDGPHGLRKQENTTDMLGVNQSRISTCFPAEVTTASSWDKSLLRKIGTAIGEEARSQNVGMVLGPGCNIKRNPLCGRNFEYFSEDPYLAGKLAASFINGVQSKGVGTSLKHFACNNQEKDRFTSDGVLDERTLREIYLTGFEIAVKEAQPTTLMCSYPKVNGIHSSDNKYLLTDILRDEWGFEGAVITDWGAMLNRIEGFKAGCDLNMPGGSAYMSKEAAAAVKNGTLAEEDIDKCVRRVLKLVERGVKAMTGEDCDYDAHHMIAEQAALSGAVLLQNKDNILPLNKNLKIAAAGYMAKNMRYQGAGSSHINPTKLSQPIDFLPGCEYVGGCDEKGNTSPEMLDELKKAAAAADAVIVFAGLPDTYESEGYDRSSIKMPQGHIDMIAAAAGANENTIVVLMCGSAVECPWADSVKAILYMGLPGQSGGSAIAKLLYGEVSPSGRLAESWPFSYDDVPSSEIFGKTSDALYKESIYVGYRYYDKAGIPVRWPFGHGLSYTSFEYSDLRIYGNTVKVDVTNIGGCDGSEVVQLFVHTPQDGIHRPLRELKGFEKIFLKKGEGRTVSFELDERCFAVYSDGWKVPSGIYEISVGGLSLSIEKEGVELEIPEWQQGSFYESCSGKPSHSEWEKLLGRSVAPDRKAAKGSYTMDSTFEQMAETSLVMKLFCKGAAMYCAKTLGTKDPDDPELKLMLTSSVGGPIRGLYILSGKSGGVFPGLLDMANGRPLRGIFKMLRK